MTKQKTSPPPCIQTIFVTLTMTLALATAAWAQVSAPSAPSHTKANQTAPTPDPGCHDDEKANEGLPPPNEDSPQPRFECDHTQIFTKPVWRGETITMSFDIRNDGEGDLVLLIGRT